MVVRLEQSTRDKASFHEHSVSLSVREHMLRITQPRNRLLGNTVLIANFGIQLTLLPALVINVQRGDLDSAAVGLYFMAGVTCVTWSQMRVLDTSGALARCMQPLLDASQNIEEDAFLRGSADSNALNRLRTVAKRLTYLKFLTRWQMLSGLHWMASLSMHCSLYLLEERVSRATSWRTLVDTIKLHQQLVVGINQVQNFFAKDLTVIVQLMLILGIIGVFRISLGIGDVNNMVILITVFSYISMVCLAAEMQEEAGEAFWIGLTYWCRWEAWQLAERRLFHLLATLTLRPSQVRFQYFGAMRLDTLSNIANAVFKYAQVLRASLGDQAVQAQL